MNKMKNGRFSIRILAGVMAAGILILVILVGSACNNAERIKAFFGVDTKSSKQQNTKENNTVPEKDMKQYVKAESGTYDIVLALDSWIGGTPAIYALDKGLDKKCSLKVGIETVWDEKTKLLGLKEGKFQAIEIALPAFLSMLKEYPGCGTIAAITDFSYGSDGLIVKKDIRDLNQIKGKKVAYLSDGLSKYSLAQFLSKAGLGYKDIIPVEKSSFEDVFEEINSGNVDAVVAADQTLFSILNYVNNEDEKMRLLLSSKDISDFMPTVLVINSDFAKRKPDEVSGFLKMWFDSVNSIMKYSDKAFLDILDASKKYPDIYGEVSEDDVKQSLSGIKMMSLKSNMEYFGIGEKNAKFEKILRDTQRLVQESASTAREIDTSKIFSKSFLESITEGTAKNDVPHQNK
ncbi:MAG TPA: ABC transporter substrate-binding protein [Ruminiclostridium sp.]|nr:ABC transporter substrate-binding protein [Ruminiclostridium sp.]